MDLVNRVPVQPNEHHALCLTYKHVAAQVTNEVGERSKIPLGRTAVLDVALSPRPRRGSTEKEPEEPDGTKNKEPTRIKKPVLFGRYPVWAVPFGRIQRRRYLFGQCQVLAVPFGRYR